MATRRRTSSVDQESQIIQQSPVIVKGRNGYYSETTRTPRTSMYSPINTNAPNAQSYSQQHRRLIRPRGSIGHRFSTDEEEGETSENSSSVKSYQSFENVEEEQDSHSSSTPSLEEGNRKLHYQQRTTAASNANPSLPKMKRIRPMRVRSNGNKSDPELGSDSMHKRALHEAGMPMSVLKGNNNNNDYNNGIGRRSIHRTGSDGSESSMMASDYMGHDDSSTNNNHNSNSSSNNQNNLEIQSGAGSPILTPKGSRMVERIQSNRLWKFFRTKNPIFLLLVTGVSTMGIGLYTQSYATLSMTLDQVITNTVERQKLVEGHFDSIEKDMQILQHKLLELHPDASVLLSKETDEHSSSSDEVETATHNFLSEATDNLLDEIVAVKERIHLEESKISTFEKYIQETSLRDATRKYGTGVLRVQLSLEFLSDRDRAKPSSEHGETTHHHPQQQQQHVLILEMAPLELMPHSVYTFLEMVDNNLLDGCSFILNAMNIIKAAPLPYEKGMLTAKQMNQNFHHLGLETVSFREYNPAFPHEQYTVGFAADGSPDFYINLGDNTEEHSGEPCFARIVSGFETVQKMQAEPLRSGMWIKKRIGIQKATVL